MNPAIILDFLDGYRTKGVIRIYRGIAISSDFALARSLVNDSANVVDLDDSRVSHRKKITSRFRRQLEGGQGSRFLPSFRDVSSRCCRNPV